MQELSADLLIVGGSDSATPAAAQAARMGVKRIVLVNDIDWFGGQWSAAGLAMIDEFAVYRGRRGMLPRTGTHKELIQHVRDYNRHHFGKGNSGNARAYQCTTPKGAAHAFEQIVAPYTEQGTGQVRIVRGFQPVKVEKEGDRVVAVSFEASDGSGQMLQVRASMTIDCSDWGDVVRLSGAEYFAGPDPQSRFGETGAPEQVNERNAAEMNSITWCVVLREAGRDATIPRPPGYDERRYLNSTRLTIEEFRACGFPEGSAFGMGLPFVDTVPLGGYTIPGVDNTYTHRRLVDRRHEELKPGTRDVTVVCRPPQDYPLCDFPEPLAEALERTEKGASKKNIVDMNYEQRALVWQDAKNYYLGYLYFLQTTAHERMGDYPESFRYMELDEELGTPDRLPPKPYIREGLRLSALNMVRRQDYESHVPFHSAYPTGNPEAGWNFAHSLFPDAVFAWQSWYDYHVTRRLFLDDDRKQPWVTAVKRDFEMTEGNRGNFPLRGLVPVKVDGLVGSFLNIGMSSIVSSGLRWHCTMPAVGQASAAVAAIALREGLQPRDVAADWRLVREVQKNLLMPPGGSPGLALVMYQDLAPDVDSDRLFEAANFLGVRGILTPTPGTLDFEPYHRVTRREVARALARAAQNVQPARELRQPSAQALYPDVRNDDPDRAAIESLAHWGAIPSNEAFRPDEPADWASFHAWMTALGWKANEGLVARNPHSTNGALQVSKPPMWKWDLAVHLWAAIKELPEHFPVPVSGLPAVTA